MEYKLLQKMGAPPVFNKEIMDNLAEQPLLPPKDVFPKPKFTRARTDKHGRRMPQAIAHRGSKIKCPENTMVAFKSAVSDGAHALETDIHLTKDGVVVLSHDKTLERCFGVDKKLLDCEWKDVKNMRTKKEPHVRMPRLEDLLRYLAEPEQAKIWLLLDIKVDNDAENVMRLMSKVVQKVGPPRNSQWEDRIVLGCWAAKFIPLCHEYFPGFPITQIGFSISYARHFFAVPNVSFNMLQASLISPAGKGFLKDVKRKDRPAYAWTVNDERMMNWCIRWELDGVVTDDPKTFLEVSDRFNPSVELPRMPLRMILNYVRINVFAWIFGLLFWWKYRFDLQGKYVGAS